MEMLDIVDEDGLPTGERAERKEVHRKGLRHRTVHIWITREVGGRTEILLQKRSMNKDSFPGKYDTSAAGHMTAGDEPLPSALRELEEELGIAADPDRLHFKGNFRIQYETEFYGEHFEDNEVVFVYLYDGEVDKDTLVLQEEEVDAVNWFDLEETWVECHKTRDRFCTPLAGLAFLKSVLKADPA